MTPRQRDLESLFLTVFAALPLYLTHAVGIVPLLLFHVAMAAIIVRVLAGRSPEILPAAVMRSIAVAYIVFYVIDAALLSRNAIAASTHLVLFIAVYQPVETMRTNNRAQRLLTAALIAVAGIATSTHITIVAFIVAFVFMMFRQMMHISHVETELSIARDYAEPPSTRAAGFYLVGTGLIGALLFPILPRVRNPFVQGMAGQLTNATTGLSESIDFNRERQSSPDSTVVARVWMGREVIPFFSPVRLRGAVYDNYVNHEWRQTRSASPRQIRRTADGYDVAKPVGFATTMTVQQHLVRRGTLFLPVGTSSLSGLAPIGELQDGAYTLTSTPRSDLVSYRATVANAILPLRSREAHLVDYPVSPEVASLARQIVGTREKAVDQAVAIERYMSTKFVYLADPSKIGHLMSVDEFLLKEHRGHCEYFAAGMVALMTALNSPARIAGGFYGGQFNPLTGYFVLRREDAHAWVEVWDGNKWTTFDPTPASLRPGAASGNWLATYASAVSESITYFWDRYILTYGLGDQVALAVEILTRTRDSVRALRGNLARAAGSLSTPHVAGLAVVAGLVWLFLAILSRQRRPLFDLLSVHLRTHGIVVGKAMTIEEALNLLRREQPDAAEELAPLIALYEVERFSNHEDRARRRRIRRGLTELR
jgi:transglutaminase-like putative cysteine protease